MINIMVIIDCIKERSLGNATSSSSHVAAVTHYPITAG